MKALAISLLALLLPAPALARVLTLSCQYESSYEATKGGSESPMSGGFSAILHMNELPGVARIETTILGCLVYVGGFDRQEVAGDCVRIGVGGAKIKETLTINRINGEFERTALIGQSNMIYSGRCAVAKKLF